MRYYIFSTRQPFAKRLSISVIIFVCFLASFDIDPVYAKQSLQKLPTQTYLPFSLALQGAQVALQQCEEKEYHVSVSVVDRRGDPIVILRGDGAGPHTIQSSTRKAYTAASLHRSTQELVQFIAENPELQSLRDMDTQILILGGGLPIEVDGDVVGGIGVSGVQNTHLENQCARFGVDSIIQTLLTDTSAASPTRIPAISNSCPSEIVVDSPNKDDIVSSPFFLSGTQEVSIPSHCIICTTMQDDDGTYYIQQRFESKLEGYWEVPIQLGPSWGGRDAWVLLILFETDNEVFCTQSQDLHALPSDSKILLKIPVKLSKL